MATTATHKFQSPKGTRDFYPADLAVRRHLESAWRTVSINHGFEEVDGPTFEHLEVYTAKSGPEIVSELFSFRRAGGDTDYALRPEFTPTLARMVAARAAQLPKPIKWFSMPSMFRAERPQRGRLREHFQWNVDAIGESSAVADAEVIAVAVGMMEKLGLTPDHVRIRMSNRNFVSCLLEKCGVPETKIPQALAILDKKQKLSADKFRAITIEAELDPEILNQFGQPSLKQITDQVETTGIHDELVNLYNEIESLQINDWCEWDHSIVRGLAYYTGTVFEIHETTGKERAIAGGGRYDHLIELFGGPPTPAVGFAMGDVVLSLVLQDQGLLAAAEDYLPRPDVFVISSGTEQAETQLRPLVVQLRRDGFHARHSYRSTRNVGKLLGEANKIRARFAVILDDELADGVVMIKNLDTQQQEQVALNELTDVLNSQLSNSCG